MHKRTSILLAEVLLDGQFTERLVRDRLAKVFQSGKRARWYKPVFEFAKKAAADHQGNLIPAKLMRTFIQATEIPGVTAKVVQHLNQVARRLSPVERPTARMLPVSMRAAKWNVPAITTTGQLARFLSVADRQLEWFADCAGRQASEQIEQRTHYRTRWIPKQSQGHRLLETPKAKLKQIQRTILTEILNRIPAHPAAHGFVRNKSCLTAARQHVGKQVVLRIDLRHFFPSVHAGKIYAIFRSAGYPQSISRILTGLCTHTTSHSALAQHALPSTVTHRFHDAGNRHLLVPHLPQGSPTSPALANLASSKLDARLTGLAAAFNATYTRYADDLVFSGNEEFGRSIERAKIWICAIGLNEGFEIRQRKTTIHRQHQQQRVHGIVVNSGTAIGRKQRDELRAILHNCVKHGPEANNRSELPDFQAHLRGRIAMVAAACPKHGDQLEAVFQQIVWDT